MLHTPAHEGADAAGFMALGMQACDCALSAQPCRAGAVMEKPPLLCQRARPPVPAVRYKLEDFRQGMAVRRTMRHTLESAKSLKSQACVWTGTRPCFGEHTPFPWCEGGVEGLELRIRAQTGRDRQSTASGVKIQNAPRRRSSRFPCPRRSGRTSGHAFGREPSGD